MQNDLTPKKEAWLRAHVPGFADMRDRAIAAGMIDTGLPMTQAQAENIKEIARRVRATLKGGVNDNAEEGK